MGFFVFAWIKAKTTARATARMRDSVASFEF
jgi:hypothetical protein